MHFELEIKKKNILVGIFIMLLYLVDRQLVNNKPIILTALLGMFLLVAVCKIKVDATKSTIVDFGMIAVSSVVCFALSQYMILTLGELIQMEVKMILINIVLFSCFHLFLFFITNNVKIACVIVHAIIMVYSFVDYLVLSFRNNEITLADITAVKTALSVAKNYSATIVSRCMYAAFASFIFLYFICKIQIESKKRKQALRFVSLGLCLLGTCGFWWMTHNMPVQVFGRLGTAQNGYFTNLTLQIRDSFISVPDGYSKEKVESILKDTEGDVVKNGNDATIIVIMNESFADLSVLGEFETNQEVLPFYNGLTENTVKGYALASVYGGQTANSEWEFLTENTNAFLPSGSVVYQQYLREPTYSILDKLHDIGYTCIAMHPQKSQNYNRDKIYPLLGFDEVYFREYYDNNFIRTGISDQEFYDKIIKRYEESAGEKLFFFGISIQNHGGYTMDGENFTPEINTTDYTYEDVNCFLSLMRESDKALENLISYFSNVERPVEIVFFGDHQPALEQEFIDELLNQQDYTDELARVQKMYTVPFFIWTNYDIQERENVFTSFNYLPIFMYKYAGISLNAKEAFLEKQMEMIPAMNQMGIFSSEKGGYKELEAVNDEEKNFLNTYEMIQYYEMFD